MIKHYEVQTKFTYGWENVWRDEDGNLYSDCCGQILDEDIMLCPECKEHC